MRKRWLANILVVVAMGLGLLTGWADISLLNVTASTVTDLFLRLLQLISLPIIFLSIMATITGMRDLQEMRKMGRKVLTYTLATTVIAASVGLALFVILKPASIGGFDLAHVGEVPKQGSYLSFIKQILPSNVFVAFTENNVIGTAFIALALSTSILFLPEEQKGFLHNLFKSLFAAMLKITSTLIKVMPLAIWAFVSLLITELRQNYDQMSGLMLYLICVVSANLIQGIVILPLMLKIRGISPWKSFKAMTPALTLAFFSKSSNATLPVSLKCAQSKAGVSPRVASFSLPLCSVINMNGCAAFILITTLFVSMVHGLTFSPFELVGWIFLATIAAVGNAGVPMGCFFLTSAFLIGMNVPLTMMGLILPFYTLLDMIETALNVWSDASITIAVDKDLATEPVEPLPDVVTE